MAIRHLRPHDAGVGVGVRRELVVRNEGDRIDLAAALGKARVLAAAEIHGRRRSALKTVLLFVVVGKRQLEIGSDGVFCAGPEHLQDLVAAEGGVIDGAEGVAGEDVGAGGVLLLGGPAVVRGRTWRRETGLDSNSYPNSFRLDDDGRIGLWRCCY